MDSAAPMCPRHPALRATFTCTRCGTYGCDTCASPTTHTLCFECDVRIALAGSTVAGIFHRSLEFLEQRPRLVLSYAGVYVLYGLLTFPLHHTFSVLEAAARTGASVLPSVPVLLLLVGLSTLCATGVEVSLIRHIGDHQEGQEHSSAQTLREAWGCLLPALGSNCVVGLGVVLGGLMGCLMGLWLAVTWGLALPAVVLGRASVLESLSTSWRLAQGHHVLLLLLLLLWGFLFLVQALTGLAVASLLDGLGGPGRLLGTGVAGALSGAGFCLLTTVRAFSYLRLSGRSIRTPG